MTHTSNASNATTSTLTEVSTTIKLSPTEDKTMTLTYKQLQSALKVYKSEGRTSIKLNAKFAELQLEYDRITMFDDVVDEVDSNDDYVDSELQVPLSCELPTAIKPSLMPNYYATATFEFKPHASRPQDIVSPSSKRNPLVKREANARPAAPAKPVYTEKVKLNVPAPDKSETLNLKHNVNSDRYISKSFEARKAAYLANLGTTEKQAIANGKQFIDNVVSFAKGFAEGMKGSKSTRSHTLQGSDMSAPKTSKPHQAKVRELPVQQFVSLKKAA